MVGMRRAGSTVAGTVALTGVLALAGCGGVSVGHSGASTDAGGTSSTTTSAPSTTSSAPPSTTSTSSPATTTKPAPTSTTTVKPTPKPTTTTPKPSPSTSKPSPKPTPKPTPTAGDTLKPGDSGAYVKTVQQQLSGLGYWLGSADGSYGSLTTQAVMALQKAAGISRDGVFGPQTRKALQAGVRPSSKIGGTGVEIDKSRQLLLVLRGGKVTTILNTSTGSGQPYTSSAGTPAIATTPSGSYSVFRAVDKLDKAKLGDLWRPRYFNGGIAVHGAGYVPGYPASHGCARVTNAAIDMIWADNLMPIGSRVVVY